MLMEVFKLFIMIKVLLLYHGWFLIDELVSCLATTISIINVVIVLLTVITIDYLFHYSFNPLKIQELMNWVLIVIIK